MYNIYNSDDTTFGEGYTSLIDCINSICTFEYELMESDVNLTKRADKLTFRLMNMVTDNKVTSVFFNGVLTFVIRSVPNQTGTDGLADLSKGFVLLVAYGEAFCVPKKELDIWLKFLRLEENFSTVDVPCDEHGNVFEWFNLLYTTEGDGNILTVDEVKWYVTSEMMLDDTDMLTPTYEQHHIGDHVGNLTMLSLDRLSDLQAK